MEQWSGDLEVLTNRSRLGLSGWNLKETGAATERPRQSEYRFRKRVPVTHLHKYHESKVINRFETVVARASTSAKVYLMATSGCSPVKYVGTCGNALYFQVVTATDVDQDAFGISQQSLKNYWVRSKDNKFLLLNPESHFEVQNLTSHQLRQPDCKFKIQIYNEIPGGRGLKGAMLYVKMKEKNMVVCCSQNHGIDAEEMDLPSRIEETKHKALFFMTASTASNTYLFESSVYHSEFLGFEPDEDKPSLHKLVLHPKESSLCAPHDICQIPLRLTDNNRSDVVSMADLNSDQTVKLGSTDQI